MQVSRPADFLIEHPAVEPRKDLLRYNGAVVVGPASDDRVEAGHDADGIDALERRPFITHPVLEPLYRVPAWFD